MAVVFDYGGMPVGALSMSGVEHRFSETRRPELGHLLLNAAHELTARMRERSAQRAEVRPQQSKVLESVPHAGRPGDVKQVAVVGLDSAGESEDTSMSQSIESVASRRRSAASE